MKFKQSLKDKYFFKCINCGKEYAFDQVKYLCPSCVKSNDAATPPKGVLKILYHYKNIISGHSDILHLKEYLRQRDFIDLLPIRTSESLPNLKIGKTPLYKTDTLDSIKLPFTILLKDDSQNPTFSFKDRASQIVSAYAKENQIDIIVAASTGNAGSSLAGICAAQNQKAIIIVPANAPKAKLVQIVMYGARIIPVDGTYDKAFDLSIEATEHFGWYNRNTAYNPLTIEGKKTVSFELYCQTNEILPDRIFVPVGDGVIISGVYKGFEDLMMLGLIEEMPVIVAVQAQGSSNLISNINADTFKASPSKTFADSISVDIPRNFYMAKDYLDKYNGEGITVSDNEIRNASVILGRNTGIFAEPAASAAFAGLLKYKDQDILKSGSVNAVLLTGSGLKDLNACQPVINIPKAIMPEIAEIEKLIISTSNFSKV
ncbi:MAG: pyridoxal-phosphate dependent enzyme [Bacteroidia bacterium]|nr:pyridoxal-phosphate dependent enzyme [Bacteroidia bacterium]